MEAQKQVQRNVLPERWKDCCYAGKYKYMNYDEERGVEIPPGFLVDDFAFQFLFPAFFNLKYDTLGAFKETTMRKGDYLLCSPAKTGTHWVWEIMTMLLKGSSDYRKEPKEAFWVDITSVKKIYKENPDPVILNTHLTLSVFPRNFRRPDTKVVVTMRNFKDLWVSGFHHRSQMEKVEWSSAFQNALYNKYALFGNDFDVFADLWDNHREDPNVLIVFYEDLKRNTREVIERIAKHMEVPYTPELISEVADAVGFEKMKAGKYASEEFWRDIVKKDDASLYRKGEIGDWKNSFSEEDNREFHAKFDEWNKDRQIPMQFE